MGKKSDKVLNNVKIAFWGIIRNRDRRIRVLEIALKKMHNTLHCYLDGDYAPFDSVQDYIDSAEKEELNSIKK